MLQDGIKRLERNPATDDAWRERIYRLWDQLAEFEVSHAEEARSHLLRGLLELTGAREADWISFLKFDDLPADDPTRGWRPHLVQTHPDNPEARLRIQRAIRSVDQGQPDITIITAARQTGRFRTASLQELATPDWFDGPAYREVYREVGRTDTLWICLPVCARAEVHIGLHRGPGQPPFGRAEREIASVCLRGLRWFYRQQILNTGLGVAPTPLTEAERLVLRGLLKGLSEKAIAEVANQSRHTTHGHVKRIFRKYDVRSRSELMALWLGSTQGDGLPWLDTEA